MADDPLSQNLFGEYSEAFKIYEDGKHRRYSLLFAVNGGAFLVLKFCNELALPIIGAAIPVGMIFFTALMGYDIWIFGDRMRIADPDADDADRKRAFLPWIFGDPSKRSFLWLGEDKEAKANRGIFSRTGRQVLVVCCALVVTGWALVWLVLLLGAWIPPHSGASPSK